MVEPAAAAVVTPTILYWPDIVAEPAVARSSGVLPKKIVAWLSAPLTKLAPPPGPVDVFEAMVAYEVVSVSAATPPPMPVAELPVIVELVRSTGPPSMPPPLPSA